jgi:5-methylcytosine-specific restriction endonuclease McrBC regulatory subunit McrC
LSNEISIKPNHDFMGLVGIQHEDILTLYGIVPRFWSDTFSDQRQVLDSNVHARILTQNIITKLDKGEAERVQEKINRVKGIYTREEDVVDPDEGRKEAEDNVVPEDEYYSLGEASEILEKLFYLCEFYHKNRDKKNINEKQEVVRDGLPIFLYEEFVEMLEQRTRELRRTYRTVVEDVGAVRGRITTRGMMMMVAQPSPMIECEYETFDIQAPLYKVMMSTLDVIRSTQLPTGFNFLEDKFEQICRRGANLRMKMAEIPSFPLAAAIRECIKLNRRLPRMFRPFEELLPIALQILKRESHRLKVEEEQQWWHITAPSSKLWELLLEKSLRMSGNRWDIEPQEPVRGPWHVKTPKSIDIRITDRFTSDVTLVDAKYSVAKDTPSPEYQYQQFFYAVKWTVEKKEPPKKVALLHPAINEEQENKNQYSIERGLEDDLEGLLDGDVKFNVWTLPFPQCEGIHDSDLKDYLKMINLKLVALLGA